MDWVKCSDRMPEYFEDVLIIDDCHECNIAVLTIISRLDGITKNAWELKNNCTRAEHHELIDIDKIKSWMPLPALPEEHNEAT